MNVVKCQNGHFFDADSYAQCPHCGAPVAAQAAPAQVAAPPQKHGFWGGRSKSKSKEKHPPLPPQPMQPVQPPVPAYTPPVPDDNSITDMMPAQTPQQSFIPTPTVDVWQGPVQNQAAPAPAGAEVKDNGFIQEPERKEQPAVQPEPVPDRGISSLKAAVQMASASSEGKTMSYFSAATASHSEGGDAAQQARAIDPVVGWLIGIGGKHLGDSFVIHAGKNSIGRSADNDIVIDLDQSISRSKHAMIVYEPKKRNFFLQPGDSSGLTYLNEEYITDSRKLAARDLIELGDSKLMFVPLCGPDFSWENYMGKENN